ncbi:hypothetical protein FA15DRAFT_656892 [Coprinopsis marcescibilis]|uniref:DUF6533 domain-containing protein n=1 Tax=Coprinopsis marcescibilis TaxID=230819 RepID=A0A5C3L4R1_COPMA|nr:hypothetical protein FA15DRAFT_656892 [Coprinopsis marcescibilis]
MASIIQGYITVTRNVMITTYAYCAQLFSQPSSCPSDPVNRSGIATTVLLFDMMLTLDEEVSSVWTKKMSLGARLFFLNRYLPPVVFAFDIGDTSKLSLALNILLRVLRCRTLSMVSTFLSVITIGTVKAILVLRTYALYQKRIVLYILGGYAVAQIHQRYLRSQRTSHGQHVRIQWLCVVVNLGLARMSTNLFIWKPTVIISFYGQYKQSYAQGKHPFTTRPQVTQH